MTNILAQKAVLAQLTIPQWGARVLDKTTTDEILDKHKAERDVGLFTKRLVRKEALAPIQSVADKARVYHHRHTQPWMDDGVRILPTALYLDYTKHMGELRNLHIAAAADFAHEYPKYKQEARKALGDLYAESDYPANIKHRFGFEVHILPVPDSHDFRVSLDKGHLEAIRRDMDDVMQQQLHKALAHTGNRITLIVGRMVERLKVYKPADKKKGTKSEGRFHDSLVENVREIAELIPAFNLNNDPKLAAIHKRIMEELCSNEPDALRDDDKLRKRVVKSADDILKSVAEFIA